MQKLINNVATPSSVVQSVEIEKSKALNMRVILKWRGNSASLCIPAAIMQAANLSLYETVDVREESGRIIIEPVRPSEYDLAQLLDGITKKNLHTETSFGPAVGKEML
jgi:antitoxin MazE